MSQQVDLLSRSERLTPAFHLEEVRAIKIMSRSALSPPAHTMQQMLCAVAERSSPVLMRGTVEARHLPGRRRAIDPRALVRNPPTV